jgi:regulatory protein
MTKEQALQKLRHYCAYQERCHSEVRQKLFQLGRFKEYDEMISTLIEENYLNEERFAIAFAGGKWRTKKWGRVKIKFELKQKGVSDYCIKKGMKEIDDSDYALQLLKLVKAKYNSLAHLPGLTRKKRTLDYLTARGFERDLILHALLTVS